MSSVCVCVYDRDKETAGSSHPDQLMTQSVQVILEVKLQGPDRQENAQISWDVYCHHKGK